MEKALPTCLQCKPIFHNQHSSFSVNIILQTLEVKDATKAKNFDKVVELRGRYNM